MRCFSLAILFAIATALPVSAHEVGDLVVAVRNAPLRVRKDGQVHHVDDVFPGVTVRVGAIKGRWLWVSNGLPGWLDQQNVIPAEKAIDYFTERIDREPRSATWRYARAIAWAHKGELRIAIADYTYLLDLQPQPAYYHMRGICHQNLEQYDKAISDFNEAIRLNPRSPRYYNSRAMTFYHQGQFDRAVADTNEAVRRNPHFASAFTNRGRAQEAKGDYRRAAEDYRHAIELDPKYADAHHYLAWLLATCADEEHRDSGEALKHAEAACQLSDWEDGSSLGALAAAHASAGQFEEAVKWETKAQSLYTPELKAKWSFLLELYRSQQAYRSEKKAPAQDDETSQEF